MPIAKNITILVNGFDLACALQSFEPTAEAEALDATVLCSDFRQFEQGFKSGSVSASGVWDYNKGLEDKIHEVMSAAFSSGDEVDVLATYGEAADGAVALMFKARNTQFGIESETGQLIMVNLEMQIDGAIGFGTWMFQDEVPEGEVEGASVDNGTDSEAGGVLSVQMQNTDATGVVVTLQHSVDDSVWVDLAATDELSGDNAAATVYVPAGTTIEQYTRIIVEATGGDAASVSAAFARR